jgi:hypothetical protein
MEFLQRPSSAGDLGSLPGNLRIRNSAGISAIHFDAITAIGENQS